MNRSRIYLALLIAALSLTGIDAHAITQSERTYNRLTRIHELMGAEKYDQALASLDKLYPSVKNSPNEAAVVLQTYGFVYASKEKLDKAIEYFRKALKLESLPEPGIQSVRYNIAQVYMAKSDYRNAIKELEIWFGNEDDPKPQAHALLGTAYAQLKQYDKAAVQLRAAIDKADQPNEGWYQLLLAIYFETKRYRQSAEILEKMVAFFPNKKNYWIQLSGVYFTLKNDIKSLAVMELAYKHGHLQKEKELVNLANMFLFQAIPYKAAKILETGLDNGKIEPTSKHWELLGHAWLQAQERERSIEALSKAAALSGDGELFINIAMIHAEREDWSALTKAISKAEKKGIKKNVGQAFILKGTAYYQLKKYDQARAMFGKAAGYKKVKKQANQWLSHLDYEDSLRTTY